MSTNYELLSDVRVYLREQVRGIEPDSVLLDAWDDFFTTYDGMIRRFATASGVRNWQVEECVREVWEAVVAELETFEIAPDRGPGRFRSWLYQLVRRTTSRVVRERIQWLASIPSIAEGGSEPAPQSGREDQEDSATDAAE